jgi:hypothetical protein
MAGLRGILAALAIGSAIMALPANAQPHASSSLMHTVIVTVPPRVKVQVASLAASTPASVGVSSGQPNSAGLSLTVNATQAWVLSIGSESGVATRKSGLQWSRDGLSRFSAVTTRDVPVTSGVSAFDAKAANLVFRNANGSTGGDSVVLTISAP